MSSNRILSALPALILLTSCLGMDTTVGPPATLQVVDGTGQTAQVGKAVGTPPSVKVLDERGSAVAGVTVLFSTDAGYGTVSGGSVVTDTAGIARVGGWTLGTVVGEQRLTAQVQSLDIVAQIAATATSGPPAGIVALAPLNYAALTATSVSPCPTVRVSDAFGNPQVGAQVTFTVLLGSGAVSGATATTDSEGRASCNQWTLGVTVGVNRLQARIATGAAVTFDAQALASPPTQITATSPANQSGTLAFQVEKTPRVVVRNASGQALAGIPVTFALVSGGDATISGATTVTGSDGVAALGDWKLGAVTTSSTVQATIPGFAGPVATFVATGTPGAFVIDLRLLTVMLPNYRDAVVAAAIRWMDVVVGALPAVNVNINQPGTCGNGTPAFSGSVPNLVIFVQALSIDGRGGIIASAGPCVRRIPSYLTALGSMRLDNSDLADMDASGRLQTVILHEMGHVFGFGTSWSEKGLVTGIGGTDPVFIGSNALALWPSFSMNYSGTPLPIETEGGSGTRDAHWRKTVWGPELMTGYIEPAGTPMPMSKLTIAVLKDFGYTVDFSAAENYRGNLFANLGSGASVRLNETVESTRFDVSTDGVMHKVTPPLDGESLRRP